MNFFQHQDDARRKTGLLILLLSLAVISLIIITVGGTGLFLYYLQTHSTSISAAESYNTSLSHYLLNFVQSDIALWAALGMITVILGGMIFKYLQLRAGGRSVAEALGGRLLTHDSANGREKKLLNIVEEMAIASGNPVPPVYIIDDDSINAFAAGLSRRDCVIGATRGCINLLNRDELQGVIAHEFSHIHNGDMRLNMRLIAILHGILLIGLIGYMVLRGSAFRGNSRNKERSAIVALALGMVVIGYGGTFFGNLIKAAVSRQREYLADASAVQYTRNPSGISNALKKIGGYPTGSVLANPRASEFSHMFFGSGIKSAISGLFATHPPLQDRIKRIEPHWKGNYIQDDAASATAETTGASSFQTAGVSGFNASGESTSMPSSQFESQAVDSVGMPEEQHIEQAKAIIGAIPPQLKDAAHEPYSARALIYCMLLDKDKTIRNQQVKRLKDKAHPATFNVMRSLFKDVVVLPRDEFIALIEMSIPALKLLSERQYSVFKDNLVALIQADDNISLFEWCVFRIVTNNVEAKAPESRYNLSQVTEETSLLFTLIAQAGGSDSPEAAFSKGVSSLDIDASRYTLGDDQYSFPDIDAAIDKLSQLKVLQKPRLLKAVAELIGADGTVTHIEAELYRAIADSLDCPVPPIRQAFH